MKDKSMYFAANIKLLRKRRKQTQEGVAMALGMKRPTLSGYENNVGQPNIQTLIAFSDYFNVAIDTLVRVDLNKLSEYQLSEIERGFDVHVSGAKLRVLTSTIDEHDQENIELVNEKAKAGYGSGYADLDYIKALPRFQLPFLPRERQYRTFQISGDSMHPIPDGAWVTGEFVQNWFALKDSKACVILTHNEGIVFKIIENRLQAEQKLVLHSLNPLYKAYDLPAEDICEIWQFVHYINPQLPKPHIPEEDLVATLMELKKDIERLKKQKN